MIKKYLNLILLIVSIIMYLISKIIVLDIEEKFTSASSDYETHLSIFNLVKKNKDYISLHSDSLFKCSYSEIKTELEKISLLSDLENVSIHEEKRHLNSLYLNVKIVTNADKNIYKFLYLIENILSGIVSINYFKIERKTEENTKIFFSELSIVINLFNSNIFKQQNKAIDSAEVENTLARIDTLCDFSFFKKNILVKHKLCGIINQSAFINNSIAKVGDNIGGFYIEKILSNRIVIKTPANEFKDVALGETF